MSIRMMKAPDSDKMFHRFRHKYKKYAIIRIMSKRSLRLEFKNRLFLNCIHNMQTRREDNLKLICVWTTEAA